jgi:tetratricopeptide (TPR) repeat protein
MHTGLPGVHVTDLDVTLPPLLVPPIDTHRRLRGPYTAAGTLMRALVPDALKRSPDLVAAHDIEILSTAPELAGAITATHETLTSLAVPEERTRFYSRLRTLRLAHGLTEFLRDYLSATAPGPVSLVFDRLDEADPTDQEFVSILLRRLSPAQVTVVSGVGSLPSPSTPLGAGLIRYADARQQPTASSDADSPAGSGAESIVLARRYVAGECTDADENLRRAYEGLTDAGRARLHDERAAVLETAKEKSLELGALAYHREHGSDPVLAVRAMRAGLDYCLDMGFYEATVDFGMRGRALVDVSTQSDYWWLFVSKTTTSLAALGRSGEAEELYDEVRAATDDHNIHMHAAYATAMLYTRHHDDDRKNHRTAMGWINEAVAFAALTPDPVDRAFNTVFNSNGRALIESHRGNLETALALVTDGIARLDKELDAGEHRLHRSVLRYNRAQVLAGLGQVEEAIADYRAVIAEDPHYCEYHFDLANLLRKAARDDEALAEYETAMRLSPPFPELYYNRADLLASRGQEESAVADFTYVLELDPGYTDAYVNLAGLLADLGDHDSAAGVIEEGLAVAPDNPLLHTLCARLALEEGDTDRAASALDRALAVDAGPTEAWALLGTLRYEEGDLAGAVDALSRALDDGPDAVIHFNRGAVHQELESWERAIADFTSALELDPGDADSRQRLATCRERVEACPGPV